ncbi:MAG: light-harvesting antenna LH1, beta subunit [Pseudomonadales bacterium]
MSNATLSGLSNDEAKEFHGTFIMGFIGFTIVAIIAHVLVWMWRPWFPGPDGYAMLENVQSAAASVIPFLS